MSLRKKTLLIIGLTLAGLLVLLYGVSHLLWLRGYELLESQRLRNNTRRALNLLREERELLAQTAADNAEWDATYAFMQRPRPDFIRSNFPNESLALLRINYLLLLDTAGAPVLSLGYDAQLNEPIPVPQSLRRHLAKDGLLVRSASQKISGILRLPEGNLLLAANPVLSSQSTGAVRGVMLLARSWGEAQSAHLTRITQLPSRLQALHDTLRSRHIPQPLPDHTWTVTDSMIALQIFSTDSSTGRVILPDIYGRPALALQVTTPPTIYKQGQASIRYFMAALTIGGVIFGIVIMLLLEKAVISRFAQLSAEVNRIGQSYDHTLRATVAGQDEVSQLASAINRMLVALQLGNEKLVAENRERERAELELKRSQEELRSLSAHLEQLREEERTHIAREIHDELGQVLSSLRMDLRTLENQLPAGKDNLFELTRSMSEVIYLTIQRVKRISQELRPSVLEHLAFTDAVSWQVDTFTAKYGIPCGLMLDGTEELKLSRNVSSALFRVLQEAFTNIIRHAEATHVEVGLKKNQTHFSMSIADNGKGMAAPASPDTNAFGLLGMRERLHRLQGSLEITSSAHCGTTIVAAIPLTSLEVA